MAVDWNDPCARATALRDAYYALISGQTESLIKYVGPEGEREVRYQPAKLEVLKAEWNAAAAECAEQTGASNRSRRFAIRAGSRRF